MAILPLRSPDSIRADLVRRYQRQHRHWLAGSGSWPLSLPLGNPTEKTVISSGKAVQTWVSAWRDWRGSGEVLWTERRYPVLGTQRWPERLVLQGPDEVAAWVGERSRWQRASTRFDQIMVRWPAMAARLARAFDVLADYEQADIDRLTSLLAWLEANPASGLFARQIPLPGLHSKWLEPRQALIRDLVAALQGDQEANVDFHRRCGLRPLPTLMTVRLLDPQLRRHFGGLDYLKAPLDDLAELAVPCQRVLIVENQQTGLALPDLPGTAAILALGYTVDVLSRIPWLRDASCWYWGDIDTHGFAILSRARGHLPQLASVLMDNETLLAHRDLCVPEANVHAADELAHLTEAEQSTYRALKENRWGESLRLEQERIAWDYALGQLLPRWGLAPTASPGGRVGH